MNTYNVYVTAPYNVYVTARKAVPALYMSDYIYQKQRLEENQLSLCFTMRNIMLQVSHLIILLQYSILTEYYIEIG